jgi:hypothetical protein
MGNPNTRAKRASTPRTGSQQYDHAYGSSISLQTPSKRDPLYSGSLQPDDNMGDIDGVGMTNDLTVNGVASLAIKDEFPTKPSLKFKSYRTGTLMTNNGVPAYAFIEAFPPPKHPPISSANPSQLSATTPAFVPGTPKSLAMAANGILPSANTVTPTFQPVKNFLKDFSSPHNAGASNDLPACNSFYTSPTSVPSSLLASPDHQLLPSARPPRVYYQRSEKSKKDIIITAGGVTRNEVKVTERFLPNGSRYHDYTHEFDGPEYNFMEDFKKMGAKEKTKLLASNQVEILVKLESYGREEKVEVYGVKKSGKDEKKAQAQARGVESSYPPGVVGNGKGKQKEDANQDAAEGIAKEMVSITIIDTINALGPAFAANTRSLCVTLDFTSIPTPSSTEAPTTPTGSRSSPAPILPTRPLAVDSNYQLITSLVHTLQSFTALKHMVINLRVLSAHNSRPISIPQLTLVLPFYDLGFTGWKVSYCTEFLTRSVPIREWDYPLKWLDRERNKILRQRERRVEEAVFVRGSAAAGKVENWGKGKK